jgi:hypothetical protein
VVLAIASPAACQLLLGMCLATPGLGAGPSRPDREAGGPGVDAGGAAGVGARFGVDEGGISIVAFPSSGFQLGLGELLCTNFRVIR